MTVDVNGNPIDETERGRMVAFCSEGDGIPDVGVSVGLGNNRVLWIGELSNQRHRDTVEAHGEEVGPNAGWWLVLFEGEKEGRVLGRFIDAAEARDFADLMVELLNSERALDDALTWVYGGEGLDEAALTFQHVFNPASFLRGRPKPSHSVQVGIRQLVDMIRDRARRHATRAAAERQSEVDRLREALERIAARCESTVGTRNGAYYRALIWIREHARAALVQFGEVTKADMAWAERAARKDRENVDEQFRREDNLLENG